MRGLGYNDPNMYHELVFDHVDKNYVYLQNPESISMPTSIKGPDADKADYEGTIKVTKENFYKYLSDIIVPTSSIR
jgi:hypothetical protein